MKHHYLPVFYLKNWAALNTGKVVQFTKIRGVTKALSRFPSAIGYVENLYDIPGADECDRFIYESGFLAKIDNYASIALREFLIEGKLTPAQKANWMHFILSVMARSPASIVTLKTIVEEFLREKKDAVLDDKLINESAGKAALKLVKDFILDEKTCGALIRMNWYSITTESRFTFMTSDRPLLKTNGLIHPTSQIFLPLSPKVIFFACNKQELVNNIFAMPHDGLIRQVNSWVVKQAVSHVYAADEHGYYFVDKLIGKAKLETYVDYRLHSPK